MIVIKITYGLLLSVSTLLLFCTFLEFSFFLQHVSRLYCLCSIMKEHNVYVDTGSVLVLLINVRKLMSTIASL